MNIIEAIPPQVYFLIAAAAVLVLLADTAVRSWRSPERVADPSWMWPRPAPTRSPWRVGPRLPGNAWTMPEPGLRLAWSERAQDSYFEAAEQRPADSVDWSALRDSYRRASIITPPAAAGPVEVAGATLDWSPIAEQAAADKARLPLDDVDEWLAERLRKYDGALARIDTAPRVTLIRGDRFRTVAEEVARFDAGSQRLHAYRMLRIPTGEYRMIESARVEALQVAA